MLSHLASALLIVACHLGEKARQRLHVLVSLDKHLDYTGVDMMTSGYIRGRRAAFLPFSTLAMFEATP